MKLNNGNYRGGKYIVKLHEEVRMKTIRRKAIQGKSLPIKSIPMNILRSIQKIYKGKVYEEKVN